MNAIYLDALPLWVIILSVALLLSLAIEGGYRLGVWRHNRARNEKGEPVGAMVASVLGLLALVLGFTFSLAASRFDARRIGVLKEANAIGTTYLRAQMLPETHRGEVSKLLREYVDVRISGATPDEVDAALLKSQAIQTQLWTHATAVAEQSPDSLPVSLFVQSLNEVIDLHSERVLIGIRSRIPLVIWTLLLLLALLGVMSVGYQAALTETRRSPIMLALVLAFTIVMALIADLDRGHAGLLRVSQQSLIDLQASLETPSSSPGESAGHD